MPKQRPIIEDIVTPSTLEIEGFQNSVLRPIIKMQHSFLILYFKNYVHNRKIDLKGVATHQQKEKIDAILTKDNRLKRFIVGAIIGHCTTEELQFYLTNSSELNRRIVNIIKKRLQDSLEEILT